MSYIYTAAATLLALLLYMGFTMKAGQARRKYAIKAPAVTGHEKFGARVGSQSAGSPH